MKGSYGILGIEHVFVMYMHSEEVKKSLLQKLGCEGHKYNGAFFD